MAKHDPCTTCTGKINNTDHIGKCPECGKMIHTEDCFTYNAKYEHDTPGLCICDD